MNSAIFEALIDYGALGIICFVMGWLLYREWKTNAQEKRRAEKRMEELEDKLREGNQCNYKPKDEENNDKQV
jgi:hypothetical protein